MSDNLIQFAPIFSAAGAKINLVTSGLSAEIAEYPKHKKQMMIDAVDEIDCFLDTKVYNDGLAAFALADFIDGEPSAINKDSRARILEGVGLTKEGRYIAQVLALQKTNKSWHSSDVPNTCTYFGDICTSRGITDVDGKRGRKSTRNPDEYHERKANGIINREQLITPALDAVHKSIPADRLISQTTKTRTFRLSDLNDYDPEQLEMILSKIKEIKGATV